jgi:hypothetical protein
MKNNPLCIDLDGALIHTDMLHESSFGLLKAAPLSVLKLPWVLLTKGKAELKQWIAKQVDFDPSVLPYNQDFVQWLREQHALGRRLVLCTASDRSITESIVKHLGFFAEVMANDGTVNSRGGTKLSLGRKNSAKKASDRPVTQPPILKFGVMHAKTLKSICKAQAAEVPRGIRAELCSLRFTSTFALGEHHHPYTRPCRYIERLFGLGPRKNQLYKF